MQVSGSRAAVLPRRYRGRMVGRRWLVGAGLVAVVIAFAAGNAVGERAWEGPRAASQTAELEAARADAAAQRQRAEVAEATLRALATAPPPAADLSGVPCPVGVDFTASWLQRIADQQEPSAMVASPDKVLNEAASRLAALEVWCRQNGR